MEKSLDAFTRERKGGKYGRGGYWGDKKRERHDNYQGFVPIVSAHSPPLALEGPELVARRRRLRRRIVRCSSSRLRFRQQQQQHEPTMLVILRQDLPSKRDRSRGTLPVIVAPGLICHPASRHTMPKNIFFLFYDCLLLLVQNVTFEGKNKVTETEKKEKKKKKECEGCLRGEFGVFLKR